MKKIKLSLVLLVLGLGMNIALAQIVEKPRTTIKGRAPVSPRKPEKPSVNFASIPKIKDMSIEGFMDAATPKAQENLSRGYGNGKEPVSVKYLKDAEGLEITVAIEGSDQVAPCHKEYYFRVLGPDGKLLSDNKISFDYKNEKLYATTSIDLDYDQRGVRMSMYWRSNEKLVPGRYKVEAYCDGFILMDVTMTLE